MALPVDDDDVPLILTDDNTGLSADTNRDDIPNESRNRDLGYIFNVRAVTFKRRNFGGAEQTVLLELCGEADVCLHRTHSSCCSL